MDYPNPFDGAEIVSTYTDAQAIEDGILVAINREDRVSRPCWEFLATKAPKGNQPPNCWPVDLMGWFRAEAIKREDALKLIAELGKDEAQQKFERMIADRKALAMASALVRTHGKQAKKVYDENTDGGIYKLFAATDEAGVISELRSQPYGKHRVLWLMPNENGGITLMFPEDY